MAGPDPALDPPRPATAAAPAPPPRRPASRGDRFITFGLKPLLWIGALAPLAYLIHGVLTDALGANPIETLTNVTGKSALVILTATLAVTPIRRISGWNRFIKVRRLLGLFAYFYATLHFLVYIVIDQFFAFEYIVEDILERPYITVGFTAFLLLTPLAITSTKGWIRRLGRRWQKLHRLVYFAAALGILHYFWKVKADTREPLVFAGVLGVLLILRVPAIQRALKGR